MSVQLPSSWPSSGWHGVYLKLYEISWRVIELVFVSNRLQVSMWLRVFMLRLFGATIGVACRPSRFRVQFPYNLSIGDRCWIGEGVRIYNPAPVTIGADSVVSQECFIVTGSHDITTMAETISPITIGKGVWLSARTIAISNSHPIIIGDGVLVTPGSVICRSLIGLDNGSRVIYGGNPVRKIRDLEQA